MPVDLLQLFQDIDAQRYGTKFFKVDLHFHTPASSDARGSNKYGYNPYQIPYPPGTVTTATRSEEIDSRIGRLLEEIRALEDIKELKDLKELPELQVLEEEYPPSARDFQYRLLFYARVKSAQIVARFLEEGLSLVAVTDHNGIGTIWPDERGRMDLAAPTWYEIIAEEAEKANRKLGTRLEILPGAEISTSGVHILAIFPPQDPRRKVHFMICDLLREVGLLPEQWGENAAVGKKSPEETVEMIYEKGGLAIPAHIDGADQGLLGLYHLESGALKRAICSEHLRGVEVVNSAKFLEEEAKDQEQKKGPTLKDQLEEARMKAGLPSLAYMQGSDAHDLKDIGKRFTFLKMTEPSFRGLETATKMASSRVRIADSRKNWNGLYIRGMAFDREPSLGKQTLRFNRNMNCIVGKIGVGKTSLFNLMKAAVDLEDPGREITASRGDVTLFVDQISKQKTDWSGTDTNAPEHYVYRRAAAEDWASLEALDSEGRPSGRKIDLAEAKDCSLQPKFYDAGKMKNIISDEQTGPETFQGFLCKYFGKPDDPATAAKIVEDFNELFFLPGFLEGEKRSKVVERINLLKRDEVKNKNAISRNVAKLQNNQLLSLSLDAASNSYRLELNTKWRRDSQPVDFFKLTLSQRKTAMICMLLMKGEAPVIIDAPEDEFDNEDMAKYLVPVLLECKDTRQILLFTNHPLLAVNTDPDNYLLIPRQASSNAIVSGFAIDAEVKRDLKGSVIEDRKAMLLEVLEGDLWAFRKRASRYG